MCVDQFGVLHNGIEPLPGALNALQNLHEKNKTVIIVSNTSSREKNAKSKFKKMGFVSNKNLRFITSGEAAWNYISMHISSHLLYFLI